MACERRDLGGGSALVVVSGGEVDLYWRERDPDSAYHIDK